MSKKLNEGCYNMSNLFKQKPSKRGLNKKQKIDFFDVVRYIGFVYLGVTFFLWGFGAYEDRWLARGMFALAIVFNLIYHRLIFKKVRDMEVRGK